jgi:hypothetical protein
MKYIAPPNWSATFSVKKHSGPKVGVKLNRASKKIPPPSDAVLLLITAFKKLKEGSSPTEGKLNDSRSDEEGSASRTEAR